MSMPMRRILTAAALFVSLWAAIFYLPRPHWEGLMALLAAVIAWEWGALAGLQRRGRLVFAGLQLLLCLRISITMHAPQPTSGTDVDVLFLTFVMSLFFWCLIVPFWLRWRWCLNRTLLLFLGVCLILATWSVSTMGRMFEWEFLVGLALAWVSDISAALAGRKSRSGGARLWFYGIPVVCGLCLEGVLAAREGAELSLWQGVVALSLAFLLPALGVMGHWLESLLWRQVGRDEHVPLLPGCGSLMAILPASFATHNMILYLVPA
jgi:CDP-diglyceride synthetase